MAVELRNTSHQRGCKLHVLDLDPEGKIGASVGQGGTNTPRDTRTVQALLNGIGPLQGGPPEMLAVDGIVGPKTIHCIRRFQLAQVGSQDGRVDPGGKTIKLLREPAALAIGPIFAASGLGAPRAAPKNTLPPPPNMADKKLEYAARLARTQGLFADTKASVATAITFLNNAVRWAQATNLQSENQYVGFVHKHFRTGLKHSRTLEGDLHFLLRVFRMIDFVMDARLGAFGGSPWGVSIFDIDRFPNLNKGKAVAYTGAGAVQMANNKIDNRYNQPMMGGTVYLCEDIDNESDDFVRQTIVHEIAHMVGDKDRSTAIWDYGYAHEHGRYNSLGKWHRMHNAENYCVFAFEAHFGTFRTLANTNNNQDMLRTPVVDGGVLKG